MGAAYEEAQAANARLLSALTQRDADSAKLLAEATAAAQERAALSDERAAALEKARHAADAAGLLRGRLADLDGRAAELLAELGAAKAEVHALAARCEAGAADLALRDAALIAQQVRQARGCRRLPARYWRCRYCTTALALLLSTNQG